ncbi:nucleoside hydrolase [Coprinopsis marcescibilis]|uniref:Nucleoside hydrolase n=1 Tax=Coprinopsis marcescibilis TaxID=230819 RepID=A0A5C3KZ99_COPMA|nr:nucleoside hydrolase [Coprinopsis marcescibilis]
MASATPRPVIIDTDPGVDDIVAILLALASPELEILAYVVSFGNTDLEHSYLNIYKAYQAVARHIEAFPEEASRFPNFKPQRLPLVIRGCDGPLQGELHSAQYFHGRDGLGDITSRHPDLNTDPIAFNDVHQCFDAREGLTLDAVLELIQSSPEESITYIALGPLTNLAQLLRKDTQCITQRIGRVVCMGGALDVPGNTTPSAEFNFFADPFAVKELLAPLPGHQGFPLDRFLLLPLDITTPHEIPFPVYKAAVDPDFESAGNPSRFANGKSPLTHFTSAFLEKTRDVMLEYGNDAMELHDIAAVWCAIDSPPGSISSENSLSKGWKARQRIFDIERYGELTRGMLVVDRRMDSSAYAPGANRAEVQKLSESLHANVDLWESTALPAQVKIEAPISKEDRHGVWCVTHTPGPKSLLRLLLQRVWNAGIELA